LKEKKRYTKIREKHNDFITWMVMCEHIGWEHTGKCLGGYK